MSEASTPQPTATPPRSVPGKRTLPTPQVTKEQLAAQEALKKAQQRKEQRRVQKFERSDKGQQWYVLCSACDSPGIMLARHYDAGEGGRVYHWSEWSSVYKGLEQPYMSHNYPCQNPNCKRSLPLSPTEEYGTFEIEESHIQWVDSDEARVERQRKADAEMENYKAVRDAATRVQLVRGGGAQ